MGLAIKASTKWDMPQLQNVRKWRSILCLSSTLFHFHLKRFCRFSSARITLQFLADPSPPFLFGKLYGRFKKSSRQNKENNKYSWYGTSVGGRALPGWQQGSIDFGPWLGVMTANHLHATARWGRAKISLKSKLEKHCRKLNRPMLVKNIAYKHALEHCHLGITEWIRILQSILLLPVETNVRFSST